MSQRAALLLAFGLGWWAGSARVQAGAPDPADPYRGLDLYARALFTLQSRYVEPIPMQTWIYRSLQGMAAGVDPWTAFYPPDVWAQLQTDGEGRFIGLGAALEGAVIRQIVPESPAARAGLQPGMTILAVGGVPVDPADPGWTARLQGEPGTLLRLTVGAAGGVREVAAVLDRLPVTEVRAEEPSDGVYLLTIGTFRAGTAAEAARLLLFEPGREPRYVILDLRGNRGGLLEEAAGVADLFLANGRIVQMEGRIAPVQTWEAQPSPTDCTAPLIVLIDGDSASAAEIVAGALQHHRRALLYGQPSYGKGTVQTVERFEDGSALKYTVARYLLPGGQPLPAGGLTPDKPVDGDALTAALARARIIPL